MVVLDFEVWVKDFKVFDLRFGFSMPKPPGVKFWGEFVGITAQNQWSLEFVGGVLNPPTNSNDH